MIYCRRLWLSITILAGVSAPAFFCPAFASGEPLDDALRIVTQAPPLEAQRAQIKVVSRTDWEAKAKVTYADSQTSDQAAGLSGSLVVEIPLFSQKGDREAAAQKTAYLTALDARLAAFLQAVSGYVEAAGAADQAQALYALAKDRLGYQKKQQESGFIEASELWPQAEATKQREYEARGLSRKVQVLQEQIARHYGGEEWQKLSRLLAAHANAQKP